MEDSSKTPEQSLVFSGTALPSANSKTVSHFGTFPPRNIQSTKANKSPSRPGGRHPPHQTDARDSVAKELVVLPFSLVRKTKKQESRWEREEEHCCRPHRAQAQKRVCELPPTAIAAPAAAGVSEKPRKHHQRSNRSTSGVFFEMAAFLTLLSSNI